LSKDGPDLTKARTWPQVVALIAGYAIIQVALSLKAETAPYSMGALIILGFLAYYIIRIDGKRSLPVGYLRGNVEGMKEFFDDKDAERKNTNNVAACDFLDRLCHEIEQRIHTLERIYNQLK
jgi:hypothetical protein